MEQKVASGFNRLSAPTTEKAGGPRPKDYEFAPNSRPAVRAVGNVWLGQNHRCAQCPVHKFDPNHHGGLLFGWGHFLLAERAKKQPSDGVEGTALVVAERRFRRCELARLERCVSDDRREV